MKHSRLIGIFSLVAAFSLSSCSDDNVIQVNQPEEDIPGNPDEPKNPDVTKICEDACSENETKCAGTKIMRCEENEDGCFEWSGEKSCGSGMICDPDVDTCVDGCVDECSEGQQECDGALIRTCQKAEDSSCMTWSVSESCGEGKHCEDNACVDGCEDECKEGESVCAGVLVRTCGQFDDDACLDLSEPQECGTDNACNDESGKCELLGCENKCDPGVLACSSGNDAVMECQVVGDDGCYDFVESKKCGAGTACAETAGGADCVSTVEKKCEVGSKKCSDDSKSVMTCVANDSGNEWKSEACSGTETCDASSAECKSTCTNACTENATQCKNASVVQVCKMAANGCTAWVDQETCGAAQSCSGGACGYSCGSDCDPFSIVIIPDTQNYTRYSSLNTNSIYHKQMKWIVNNKSNQSVLPNLKMVVHMGDITNDNTDIQWKIAKDAQDILLNAKIPFTIMNGNHDYRVSGAIGGRSKTKFTTYFPKSYLEKIPGYAGVYSDVNTYYTFTGGGQKYLVLSLEYAPRQQTICWANNLLQNDKYKDYKTIVVTHGYVSHTYNDSNGKPNAKPSYCGKPKNEFVANGASGSELWTGLVARHSNIVMVLSGHVGDSERREDKGYNGNLVEQILTDYQFEKPCTASSISGCTSHCAHVQDAGNGWLRVLTFYPKENRVVAKTISVLSGNTKTFSAKGTDQFFCSELFPEKDPTASYADWYPQKPSNVVHQYEFTYDFTSKMNNTYKTNDYLGFVHRGINNTSTGDQTNSSIATNDTGRMIFVWEDDSSSADGKQYNSDTNAHDIYGRILIPGGCNYADHAEIVINKTTAGHQADPDVAMDKNGNFVVVWTDDNDNNGSTQVYMRGFNADGSERFATKTVNTVDTRNQYQARIAMAPDGQFAVSWTDTQSSKSTPQIMVRGFNANGSQSFADRAIADTVAGTRVHSDIFMDQNHNIVVVWEDDEDGNGATQARMRILNADGTSKTGLITVNTKDTGNQDTPSISGKQDGSKFIVTWKNTASDKTSIMARTFDANGKQVEADFTASKTAGTVSDPQVCMNNAGNAVITWYNSTKRDVYSNKFTSNKIGTSDSRVNSPGNESAKTNKYGYPKGAKSLQPAIACVPNGKARMISFTDDNDGNGTYEIFGVGGNI